MSNLKNRILKIEQSKAGQQVAYVDSEKTRQWLNDLIQSINDGTHIPDPTPRKPLPPDASPTAIWLDEMLNEIDKRHEHTKKTA